MGGPRQHVGTVRGLRLWQSIYESLLKACPLDSKAFCKACQKNEAKNKVERTIVYNSGKNTYATNAHLTVCVLHSIQNTEFKGMYDAMVGDVFSLGLC